MDDKYKLTELKYTRTENALEKSRIRAKKYRDNNKDKIREHNKSLYNSEQKIARRLYSNYVRDNKIKQLNYCEICGDGGKIEAHHFNYKEPLRVIYLCIRHHKDIHKYLKLISK